VTSNRPRVGRLAGRIAGTYPLAETYHHGALEAEMVDLTDRVSDLVPEATGLTFAGSPTTKVIDRMEWIERNVASFAHLMEPARLRLDERAKTSGARGVSIFAGKLVQAETTTILSILARRVLGQYELVLPTGEDGDAVVYVGPNVMSLERTHQFRPSEFRFWVALHELTHRAQFQGVPWLRGYFMGLVTDLVEQSSPEPGKLNRVLQELGARRDAGVDLVDERGLFGLFASPQQRAVIDRVQALMTMLEGHGHVVMDRVGSQHLRSQDRMSRILKGRRHDRRTAAFFRLTGLEMKLKQYQMGEAFIHHIEREADWKTVNLAFRGAGSLPTLEEIENPLKWLARVA
jgi:coenzyme F420 biosynthesis associated uncharacterized protein